MSNKILPVLLLVFSTFSGLRAQIMLRGTVQNMPDNSLPQMALERWDMDHWSQITTIYLGPDHSFHFNSDMTTPGQYRLRMWGQARMWSDFVVPDSAMLDTALVFALDYGKMDGNPAKVANSAANNLYFDLITEQQKLTSPDSSGAAIAGLDKERAAFNRQCSQLAAKYRNTLIGDIALLLIEPQIADYPKDAGMTANAFAKAHALDRIPFHHENILNHNAFVKLLNRYFNYFERSEAGGKEFIDGVMARRNGNDAVDGYLFRYLLNKMMDYKNDGALTYLLNWYAPDCTDENPLPNSTEHLVEALKACTPGQLAPDISMPGTDGTPISLGAVCAQNKLTLMLFWRSTCSHCKEFEPELVTIYQKYHPLGVEVYALSVDKNTDNWLQDLKQNPTPWVNTFIPATRRSEINRSFPAPSTPTLIALDKDRRVISRVLSRGNLSGYLDEELKKLNAQ